MATVPAPVRGNSMQVSASIARGGRVEGGRADNHTAQGGRAAGRPTQGGRHAGAAQFKLRTRAIGGSGCGGDGCDHAAGGLRITGAGVVRQRRRALAGQVANGLGTDWHTGLVAEGYTVRVAVLVAQLVISKLCTPLANATVWVPLVVEYP